MRLSQTKRHARPIPMTSMIDVIFLLLLFFMLSTRFGDYGEIPLSQGGGGAIAPATADDVNAIVLELGQDEARINLEPTKPAEIESKLTALENDKPMIIFLSPMSDLTLGEMMTVYQRIDTTKNRQILLLDKGGE